MDKMKYSFLAMLALCTAVAPSLHAGRRRAVVPPQPDVVTIEFVDVAAADSTLVANGGDAWVDVKAISRKANAGARSTKIRRQFGVRVVRPYGAQWGTAKLTAKLTAPDGRSSIRIDGQPLGLASIVIEPRAAIGTTTIHTIELEVPDSAAAGALNAAISWEATTQ